MEEDENDLPTTKIMPKEKAVSNRLPDIPQGQSDCYWCGRVFDTDKMTKSRMHNSIVYICKDCG